MFHTAYVVQPKKSVVALHDGKFHEYAVVACDDGVRVRFDDQYRLVTVYIRMGESLTTRPINYLPEEDLRYLVLDLTQDTLLTQVVGVAEEHSFDESAVGTIHLFV